MKYIFIAPIFQMDTTTILNKGLDIGNGMYVTNNINSLKILFSEKGVSTIDQIEHSRTYFRYDGEFLNYEPALDDCGSKMVIDYLREVQYFLNTLWQIKDHGSYVKNGYILFYNDNKEDMDTYFYKGELNQVVSLADGSNTVVYFSPEEIHEGFSLFIKKRDYMCRHKYEGYNATDWLFYDSCLEDRANYFLLAARSSTALPMKLFFYCSLLELLFSIDSNENKLKIAERVSISIGTDKNDIITNYRTIVRAYNVSSKLINGSILKQRSLSLLTVELDLITRKVFNSETFHKLNYFRLKDFSEYFLSYLSD